MHIFLKQEKIQVLMNRLQKLKSSQQAMDGSAIPDTVAWTDMMVGSYVGYQVYNGKPIYGLDTDFAGRIKIPSTRIQPVVKPQPAPKNLDVDGPVVNNIQSKYPDLQTYEYNSYTNPGPLNDLRGQLMLIFMGDGMMLKFEVS